MMSDVVVSKQTFQDRMKERIRSNIGELMTDEELSKIVETSVKAVFFESTEYQDGYHTRTRPPFIYDLVKELLEDTVRIQVSLYITEHEVECMEVVKKVVSDGVGQALLGAITNIFQNNMHILQNNITESLQNMGNQ